MRDLPPIPWVPDAWACREYAGGHSPQLDTIYLHKKLDHLLSGMATIIEALASVLEGQVFMQAELQPVLDAINDLATEEGLVANAVKSIVDKVNNGQVVVKADAQVLVDAINGVTENLKAVVGAIPEENPPVEGVQAPAPSESEVPPVPGLIPVPPVEATSPVPVGPDTSGAESVPAGAPYSTGGADANSPASVTGPETAESGIAWKDGDDAQPSPEYPVSEVSEQSGSPDTAPSELSAPTGAPDLT